ncbi:MAG: 30S ribosomal protein S6 [Bifidobacteriaceae bacterium]|jgi:small subunit ribosomal protein S6|nr:30S ribosomal protein S6 [Bifidobacteriaceae bacterium]
MRPYEIMIILDPETEEKAVPTVLGRFTKVITKAGGTIDNQEIWGKRRLSYDIKKKSEGIYAVINFTAPAEAAKEMDRLLTLNEAVLRTKLMRADA